MTGNNWSLTGNEGTDPDTNFLGTNDFRPLIFKVNGREVMRIKESGNVGIGTDPGSDRLAVRMSGEFGGFRVEEPGGTTSIINGAIEIQGNGGGSLIMDGASSQARISSRKGDLVVDALNLDESGHPSSIFLSPRGGNVGIGINPERAVGPLQPETTLHVDGDRIRLQNNTKILDLRVDGGGVDLHTETDDLFIRSNGPRGHNNVLINPFPAQFGDGNVGIGTTTPHAKLHVAGDLLVTGTKSFVQTNPADPTKDIVYVALEGGEAGTYVRGTGVLDDGKATIELPEHFSLLTGEADLTVQLTPRGAWLQLYVTQVTPTQLVVMEAQGNSGQFDYLIQGVRKGYEHHQVIREKAG